MNSTIEIADKLRPCYADGKKALFHRWIEKETPILHFTGLLVNDNMVDKILKRLKNCNIVTEGEVYKQKATFAVVEFEDGTVSEVEPEKIRFLPGAFGDYDFTEEPKSRTEEIIDKMLQAKKKHNEAFPTIPVRFKPGDKIYYKDRNGDLQESIVAMVEPMYTHIAAQGDKSVFYDNYIGEIIFPRD